MGIEQPTSDALTLLREVSNEWRGPTLVVRTEMVRALIKVADAAADAGGPCECRICRAVNELRALR